MQYIGQLTHNIEQRSDWNSQRTIKTSKNNNEALYLQPNISRGLKKTHYPLFSSLQDSFDIKTTIID